MRDIILLCIMALFFAFGYKLMRKIDFFLQDMRRTPEGISEAGALRIGFEHSEDIVLIEETVEKMARNVPKCNMHFFYGTYEEIKRYVQSGKVDIGFLDFDRNDHEIKRFCWIKTRLPKKNVEYKELGIPVEPLDPEKADRRIVWERHNSNRGISIFVKYLTEAGDEKARQEKLEKIRPEV